MSTLAPAGTARPQSLHAPTVTDTPAAVLAHARQTTRVKASTFSIACRLLPAAVRNDVYLLYLVLRTLDDLVDEGVEEAHARVDATARWARHEPAPRTPEVELLDAIAARHDLPRAAVADFCQGMHQDLSGARHVTEHELDSYCYRVAGTVGVLMAAILGTEDIERALPAAAALGMAMQRTNILRDIDEDYAAGRIYLAADTISRHGSIAPGQRAELLRDQIARADALYEQGLSGLSQLRRGRRAIAAAAMMYREILREIERRGYGRAPERAIVSRRRKLAIAVAAAARA